MMAVVSDGILIFDAGGHIKAANDSAATILGYPDETLAGQWIGTYLSRRDWRLCRQWLKQNRTARQTAEPGQRFEISARHANGVEFPMALTVSRWKDSDSFIVAFQDLTQNREMLRAREEAEKRLQRELLVRRLVAMVNDSLDMGVILQTTARELGEFLKADRAVVTRYNYDEEAKRLDMVMTCQYCANEQILPYADEDWAKIFRAFQHLTPERVKAYIPETTMEHDPHKNQMFYQQMFEQLDVTEINIQEMMAFQAKYGAQSSMRTRIFYNETLLGFIMLQQCSYKREWQQDEIELMQFVADQIGIALAQADLYKAEQVARQAEAKIRQEAEKANAKKSEFLAMISHELRTPLNSVIGYTQMMESGMAGPITEKQAKYLQHVSQSGRHLLDIVNDLLDVSRVESGNMTITPTRFELRPVVAEVCAMMQESAAKKHISMACTIQPEMVSIEADPARFRQILINLLSNAIKFNHETGYARLRLNLSDDGQWLVGEVEDNGIGIPADKQAELFRKFYQVDSRMARQHEGTGLGLALTKELVELHGGNITLTSKEGQGSTFTFRLPVSQSTIPDRFAASSMAAPGLPG